MWGSCGTASASSATPSNAAQAAHNAVYPQRGHCAGCAAVASEGRLKSSRIQGPRAQRGHCLAPGLLRRSSLRFKYSRYLFSARVTAPFINFRASSFDLRSTSHRARAGRSSGDAAARRFLACSNASCAACLSAFSLLIYTHEKPNKIYQRACTSLEERPTQGR
jgi:hypothetical protein